MDEIVAAAMRKWPNVPDVYDWLALDKRGNWLLRGERISNAALIAFINRNYMRDLRGCWYFQNGPQRVFATLHATPFIFSVERRNGRLIVSAHTGAPANNIDAILLDETGQLILATDLGPGLVNDRDLAMTLDSAHEAGGKLASEAAFDALRQGRGRIEIDTGSAKLPLHTIAFSELPSLFHFEPRPAPPAN
jgi:hypothetical protein